MSESAEELARRALRAALAKLESNGSVTNGESSPLVVLVVGNPSDVENSTSPGREHRLDAVPGSHPGLEKFPLGEVPAPSRGTKPCYMEPDKPCVASGACEMRGY